MDKVPKYTAGDRVSHPLLLPIKDLAQAIVEIEACRAGDEALDAKLDFAEVHRSVLKAETGSRKKVVVHCRSGFHAR